MKKNTGFTLIEVLITMVIMAVGMLGLAGLQATTMSNNHDAYLRSQATLLAYDLADRMRANATATNAGTYITAANQCTKKSSCSVTATANCKTTTGCSVTQMAQTDVFDWQQNIGNLLPDGSGTMTVASNIFTITISWDDDLDGVDSNNSSFATSFQL